MTNRADFARRIAELPLSHVERAIAMLWYFRDSQEFDERSAKDLADDLQEESFPRPNVTRLKEDLRRSSFTVRGRQPGTFQIDLRKAPELEKKYGEMIRTKRVPVTGEVIPMEWVLGTRRYLEQIVYQINGCYESGFHDACAALCRRLMESLIIEVYVHEKRHHEIQSNGVFLPLERLIGYVTADKNVALGRNTPKTMIETKQLGDTAAHDRVYITPQIDIDDHKAKYRRMIQELLEKAGIQKT